MRQRRWSGRKRHGQAGAHAQRGEDRVEGCPAGALQLSWLYVRTALSAKDGSWYLGASPSRRSVQRCKAEVSELLVAGNMGPWEEMRDRLNRLCGVGRHTSAMAPVCWPIGRSSTTSDSACMLPAPASQGRSRRQSRSRRLRTAWGAAAADAACLAVGRAMKPVGKPDAGNPHVRFDERGRETERPQRRNRARPRLYLAHEPERAGRSRSGKSMSRLRPENGVEWSRTTPR